MDIEKLPQLEPRDFGYTVDRNRPVLSCLWSVDGPHRTPGHTHPRGHIVFPTRGVYWVITPHGSWVAPAGQAIWIPPHLHHAGLSSDAFSAQMLFVDVASADALPTHCVAVSVSPLLRELAQRVIDNGNVYGPGSRAGRVVRVLLDELKSMQPTTLFLPMARDRRVCRLMETLIRHPEEERGFAELARAAGASGRTLARLFHKETGLTFGEWRKRLRLLTAIDRLEHGQSVTVVAMDLGYSSASAFIAMFRRTLGVPPGHYLDRAESGARSARGAVAPVMQITSAAAPTHAV